MTFRTVLGPLPDGWEVARLGDLASKIGSGATPRGGANVYVDDGVAFIRSQNVLDHSFDRAGLAFIDDAAAAALRGVTVEPGDVLLNITGDSILRCAVVPPSVLPARVSQHVAIIRTSGVLEPLVVQKYLTLPGMKHWLLGLSSGGTRKAITKAHIESVLMPMPPESEQRGIAEVLGSLDARIEANQQLLRTIVELLHAEFVRATIDRQRAAASTALIVEMGSPFGGAEFTSPGLGRPLVRIRDLKSFTPQVWTTEERDDEKVVRPGDVLVGMDAEFRSTFWLGEVGVLNQRVCRFSPRTGVARAFALFAIRPDLAFFENAKSGTTVIHLNKSDIDRFAVPNLSEDEHRQYAELSEPLVDRVVAASRESRLLADLRDTLAPELLSGRLRVEPTQGSPEPLLASR
jgi:type I restriction enzyme, S subunit